MVKPMHYFWPSRRQEAKLIQKVKTDLEGKSLLTIFIVTGIAFSSFSGFVLSDGFGMITPTENVDVQNICHNGLCNIVPESKQMNSLVQLSEDSENVNAVSSNELFTNLKLDKNKKPVKDSEIFGNNAILFAEKDSFIRESVKNTNEGSNEVLRVMGSGPTNNRAVVAFDQEQIDSASKGKILESATLKLFVKSNDGNWNGGQDINIHRITSEWFEGKGYNAPLNNFGLIENGISWNCPTDLNNCSNQWNGGLFNEIPTDSIFISNHVKDGYWIKFDVTTDVNDYLSGTYNFGWIIKKSDEDSPGRINFAAREANSNIPELVMVFSK